MGTFAHLAPRRLVAAAALLLATSCGVSGGDDGGGASSSTTTTVAPDAVAPNPPVASYGPDQCPTAEEVGRLVGTEVLQTPWVGSNFSGDLSTSASGCSYAPEDAASMFDDQITISRLSVDVALAETLFAVMDRAALADADENGFRTLDGLGDEAVLDGREVAVRAGDTIVWVEVEPEGGAEPGSDNPAIDLAEAALGLGLRGDDPPGCDDLEDVVADELGPVADTIIHSSYLGFDEVEITGQGCALELEDGTEATISVSSAEHWDAWLADNADSEFNADYESLTVAGRAAFDDGERLVVDDGTGEPGDSPFEIEAASTTLDEDQRAALRVALAELAIGA